MTFFYICIYIIRYVQSLGPRSDLSSADLAATRIMMTGFLEGHQANGAFVAVGPPGKYNTPRGMLTLTTRT